MARARSNGGIVVVLGAMSLLLGCASDGVPAGDGAREDLSVPGDLAPPPDRAAPPDAPRYELGAPDQAVISDLATSDVAAPDFAAPPDLGMPLDFALPPDLALPDLATPDLVQPDAVFVCQPGFADCNRLPGDGCEVNLRTDVKNCGHCGFACAPQCGQPAACQSGVCWTHPCLCGFEDCDKFAGNGCETNVNGDVKNCGACGNACAPGMMCLAGKCM